LSNFCDKKEKKREEKKDQGLLAIFFQIKLKSSYFN